MNNVNIVPVDVEEMRLWALGFMKSTNPPLTKAGMAKASGIPYGTLGPWLDAKYAGRNDNIARQMLAYKQQVEASKKVSDALPVNPGYFDTPTSVRFEKLLALAHTGRITVIGTGPGTGKTITIDEYRESRSEVYVATMSPSKRSLVQMITEVQLALGMIPKKMRAADASRRVVDRLTGRNMLLVIDEANSLNYESIDELRSWHDATGCGLCLAGNEELIREIQQGKNKDAYARLNSRIQRVYVQQTPTEEDVLAFCDAWGINDPAMREYLTVIGTHRDAGGLRECKNLVEIASLIADEEGRGVMLYDLQDVQRTRGSKWIRT